MRLRAAIPWMLVSTGCAVGPDFHRPAAPPVSRYTADAMPAAIASAQGVQWVDPARRLAADWWRLFGCRALDALVADAIQRSPNLQAAQASLLRSEDSLRAGYGVFYPQADVGASALRQKFNPQRFGQTTPVRVFNLFTLQGSVSYTLDVWGGQRRSVEAQSAQVDAAWFTMLGSYIMLTGNVVDAVLARAAYRAQIDATKEVIELQKEQARIADVQARAGTGPYTNVLTVESELASTQATLPPLELKYDQAGHLLAALTGRMSAGWAPPPIALADVRLPRDLPVSLPSQLVRQRPDILVAEADLHTASANVGVATAAMLPNLTLSGTYGVNSTSVADLFSSNSPFWSLGAGLTAPVFHGTTLHYQRRAAVDAFEQAFAQYRQTVLSAFQQVADALRALVHDAESVDAQTTAVRSSGAALRLLQANYDAGLVDYLQVLVADQRYLQARIAYVQALAQQLQDTVALYVALGGGWWNDRELAPPAQSD